MKAESIKLIAKDYDMSIDEVKKILERNPEDIYVELESYILQRQQAQEL